MQTSLVQLFVKYFVNIYFLFLKKKKIFLKKNEKSKKTKIWPNLTKSLILSNLVRFGQSLIFLLCSYLLKFFVFFFKNKEYMLTKYLTNSWTKEVCTIYYKFEKKNKQLNQPSLHYLLEIGKWKQTVEPKRFALFTINWKKSRWNQESFTINCFVFCFK